MAVNTSQSSLYLPNLLANLWTKYLELWLEAVGEIFLHIILEGYSFQIQLAGYNLLEEIIQLLISLYIHIANRLTILDIGSVTGSTSQNNDFQYQLHLCLQLSINESLIGYREVTKMD